MKLYGTLTSPYVRRVRILAQRAGAELEIVDTSTDEGQAALRAVTPIWKIPTLETPEGAIFDSNVIARYLLQRYGDRGLRATCPEGAYYETNLVTVMDGALDAGINLLYLKRDGLEPEQASYLGKQRERMHSAMQWVASKLRDGYLTSTPAIGWAEIALVTTLDWMRFRKTFDTSPIDGLDAFSKKHADEPSFRATLPPG